MFTKNSLKARKFTAYQVILLLTVLIPAVAIAQQVGTEVARYPGSHKIVVHKDDVAGLEAIGRLRPSHVIDYPDRKVFIVKDTELRALTPRVKEKVSVKDDLNKIFLRDRVDPDCSTGAESTSNDWGSTVSSPVRRSDQRRMAKRG